MTKRLSVKVGEYEKDGQTKGEYIEVGVILQGDDGEYALLNPSVSLAGILAKQNIMALNKGANQRDMITCGIYENTNNNQQQGQQQQGGFQQNQQQGGFNSQGNQQYNQQYK